MKRTVSILSNQGSCSKQDGNSFIEFPLKKADLSQSFLIKVVVLNLLLHLAEIGLGTYYVSILSNQGSCSKQYIYNNLAKLYVFQRTY